MKKHIWQFKLESKIKKYLENSGGCHDYWHAVRVKENARQIASKIKCDFDILSAAALLHDVGYHGNDKHKLHFIYSMKLAKKWLPEVGFPKSKMKDTPEAIRLHDNYSWGHNYEPTDRTEAKIIQDADRIDALGVIGIVRVAYFFGEKKFPIYNSKPLSKSNEVWLNHSLIDQLRREPMQKWSHLNFEYSKKISKKRFELFKKVYNELRKEILNYHDDWETENAKT